jgi:hypothetical protein
MPKEFLNTRFAQYTQWNEFIFATLISNRPYTTALPQQPTLYIKNNTLYIELPEGMEYQKFTMSGGSGDADLYVTYGTQSTTSSYDCRPYKNGNNETCNETPHQHPLR